MRLMGKDSKHDEDDELAAWLHDGYAAAYRTAYLILHDRQDAEEAVQEAFLRAWRFRAAVPDGAGVRPWLYRVVVNACLSKLRSDRSRRERAATFDEDATGRPPWSAEGLCTNDPEMAAEAQETQRAVVEAIGNLPEHLRVVIVLRFFGQLAEREIADVIHRRPGTVKSRLHEGRSRLGSDPLLADYRPVTVSGSLEGSDD
jgi:RNA polymerase sigma-70 factor, ECF subfamily